MIESLSFYILQTSPWQLSEWKILFLSLRSLNFTRQRTCKFNQQNETPQDWSSRFSRSVSWRLHTFSVIALGGGGGGVGRYDSFPRDFWLVHTISFFWGGGGSIWILSKELLTCPCFWLWGTLVGYVYYLPPPLPTTKDLGQVQDPRKMSVIYPPIPKNICGQV